MDENILENKEATEQVLPSDGTSEIETPEVQTSEPPAYEPNGELILMTEHYEKVETQLDSILNVCIVVSIGIGLLFGAFAIKSLFDFLR